MLSTVQQFSKHCYTPMVTLTIVLSAHHSFDLSKLAVCTAQYDISVSYWHYVVNVRAWLWNVYLTSMASHS